MGWEGHRATHIKSPRVTYFIVTFSNFYGPLGVSPLGVRGSSV